MHFRCADEIVLALLFTAKPPAFAALLDSEAFPSARFACRRHGFHRYFSRWKGRPRFQAEQTRLSSYARGLFHRSRYSHCRRSSPWQHFSSKIPSFRLQIIVIYLPRLIMLLLSGVNSSIRIWASALNSPSGYFWRYAWISAGFVALAEHTSENDNSISRSLRILHADGVFPISPRDELGQVAT